MDGHQTVEISVDLDTPYVNYPYYIHRYVT